MGNLRLFVTLHEQYNMDTVCSEKGGARIGSSYWAAINATVPWATLEVPTAELRLSVTSTKILYGRTINYVFQKDEITRLSLYQGMFTDGIKIEHQITRYEKFIVYWSQDIETTVRMLRRLGYIVNPK